MKQIIFITFVLLTFYSCRKDEDHLGPNIEEVHGGHHGEEEHEHESKALGEGKAIIELDEERGFKLSKEAIKTLKLTFLKIEKKEFLIEKQTLVTSKKYKGIYRFRDGYFKLLSIKFLKEINNNYLIKVDNLNPGDQIVTNGVGLLKVADIYSKDTSEYGHGH